MSTVVCQGRQSQVNSDKTTYNRSIKLLAKFTNWQYDISKIKGLLITVIKLNSETIGMYSGGHR